MDSMIRRLYRFDKLDTVISPLVFETLYNPAVPLLKVRRLGAHATH